MNEVNMLAVDVNYDKDKVLTCTGQQIAYGKGKNVKTLIKQQKEH